MSRESTTVRDLLFGVVPLVRKNKVPRIMIEDPALFRFIAMSLYNKQRFDHLTLPGERVRWLMVLKRS